MSPQSLSKAVCTSACQAEGRGSNPAVSVFLRKYIGEKNLRENVRQERRRKTRNGKKQKPNEGSVIGPCFWDPWGGDSVIWALLGRRALLGYLGGGLGPWGPCFKAKKLCWRIYLAFVSACRAGVRWPTVRLSQDPGPLFRWRAEIRETEGACLDLDPHLTLWEETGDRFLQKKIVSCSDLKMRGPGQGF